MRILAKLTFAEDLVIYSETNPFFKKGEEILREFERDVLLEFLSGNKPIQHTIEPGVIVNLGVEWFSNMEVIICKETVTVTGSPSDIRIKLNSL
jgi:hypothetical protein